MKNSLKNFILPVFLLFLTVGLFSQAKEGTVLSDTSGTVDISSGTGTILQKKIALVIGNSRLNEKGQSKFVTDAMSVAAVLSEDGFSVTTVLEGDQRKLLDSIQQFMRDIRKADVSFLYYAGNGLQCNSVNYLIPAKTSIQTAEELTWKAVNSNDVLDSIYRAKCKKNLIMIDTCLADINESGNSGNGALSMSTTVYNMESFMAFASIPGEVLDSYTSQTSPFTEALLNYLREPGLDIRVLAGEVTADAKKATNNKQTVWTSSTIGGQFCLVDKDNSTPGMFAYPKAKQTDNGETSEKEVPSAEEKENIAKKITIRTTADGTLYVDSEKKIKFARHEKKTISVSNEKHSLVMKYVDGYEEKIDTTKDTDNLVLFHHNDSGKITVSGVSPFILYVDGKRVSSLNKGRSYNFVFLHGEHKVQAVYKNKFVETKTINLQQNNWVLKFKYKDGGTGGQRFAASFFNPFLGVGSYNQGDTGAGTTILLGEAFGGSVLGLFLYMRSNWETRAIADGYTADDVDFTIPNYGIYAGAGILGTTLLFAMLKPYFFRTVVPKKDRFVASSKIAMQKISVTNLSFNVSPDKSLTVACRLSW